MNEVILLFICSQGVVQVEKLKTPEDFIPPVLERVKKDYLCRVYRLKDWEDPKDFLDQVARRTGKLLKGGEPDNNAVARMVLNDWQRGKLPFFVAPVNPDAPKIEEKPEEEAPTAVTEESTDKTDKKKFEPRLAQDFSKIRVDLKYEGDDIQPLEPQPEFTEDPSDNEEDGEEGEADSSTVADGSVLETKSADVSKENDEEIEDDDSDDYDEIDDDDEEDSDEDATAKKRDKTLRLKTRTITKSGAFTVKPNSKSSKKKNEDDELKENPRWKLTSRERRKIDRDQKKKKVGTHFYEVVNVKNKSKKKGFLEMAKAFRGHCKK